jgi:hypothetical protein
VRRACTAPLTSHLWARANDDLVASELDALRKTYGSRTLRVCYDSCSVEYGSEADLICRIRTIESEMAAAEGGTTIRTKASVPV